MWQYYRRFETKKLCHTKRNSLSDGRNKNIPTQTLQRMFQTLPLFHSLRLFDSFCDARNRKNEYASKIKTVLGIKFIKSYTEIIIINVNL